jgi:hypothetical protein
MIPKCVSEELQGGARINMSKMVVRCTALCVAVVGLAIGVSGCWNPFAPPGGDPPPPTQLFYKVRTSPDNVVHNLNTAYKDKNAQEYLDCLAEDFEFHLNPDDYEDPDNNLPESWGKIVEQDIHEAMFADGSGVLNVSLTLTNISKQFNPGALPADPSDDTWTYREQTDLFVSVEDPPDLIYHANADQEFVFRIDPDETGPEGETLWEIIEWWDLQPPERRDAGYGTEVAISVGALKAIYR